MTKQESNMSWKKKNADYLRIYKLLWKRRWRLKQGMKPSTKLPQYDFLPRGVFRKKKPKVEKDKVLAYKDYINQEKQRNEKSRYN